MTVFDLTHIAQTPAWAALTTALSEWLNEAGAAGVLHDAAQTAVEALVEAVGISDGCPRCEAVTAPYRATTSGGWVDAVYRCASCSRVWTCSWPAPRDEAVAVVDEELGRPETRRTA